MSLEILPESKDTKSGCFKRTENATTPTRDTSYSIVIDFRSLFNLKSDKSDNYEMRVSCGKDMLATKPLVE